MWRWHACACTMCRSTMALTRAAQRIFSTLCACQQPVASSSLLARLGVRLIILCRPQPLKRYVPAGLPPAGENKRLATAEVLVGPQRVLMLDEISTGLDSATLYSVIQFLSALTKGLQATTVVALLQVRCERAAVAPGLR